MKRYAENLLEKWISESPEKICLVTGFRGTGKTWLAMDFAGSFSQNTVYFNFETDGRLRKLTEEKNITDIADIIKFGLNSSTIPAGYLFIFDEIGYSDNLCKLLFAHSVLDINGGIIVALSGPEIYEKYAIGENDRVYHISLKPLSFDEYLSASSRDWYREVIEAHFESNKKIPGIVHNELMDIFNDYLHIGGMPSVVSAFLDSDVMYDIEERQKCCFNSILADSDTINPSDDAFKRRQILLSIDDQFIRSNKRFRFSDIRKGVTYSYYADPISELISAGMISKLDRINLDDNPSLFRLYYNDNGLLNYRLRSDGRMNEDVIFRILLDNYLVNELSGQFNIGYWESTGSASVNHVIKMSDGYIPIECFYPGVTRTKGITSFQYAYKEKVKKSYIVTDECFYSLNEIKYIPYYSIFCLKK